MRLGVPSALVVIASIVVVLSATAARVAAAPPDPCSLLTPAEVSDAFGVPVKAGQLDNPTLCDWSGGGKRLTLLITDEVHFTAAKHPHALPGVTVTSTPGVGDDAVLTTTGGSFASIMVKKGAVYFMLRVYGFPLDQAETKEKALASAAAKKI